MIPDSFDILGLPPAFELDPAVLDRAFLRKSALVHPDHAVNTDDHDASAELNRARAELADPERRANLLLSRLRGPTKEQDKALPPGFLTEIMQTREEIEEDLLSSDPADREKWRAWSHARRAEYAAKMSAMFSPQGAALSPADLAAIRRELNAWRYIERLIEQLNPEYDPARADWEPR